MKLFVASIDYEAREADLEALFEASGFNPKSVRLCRFPDTNMPRGYGFVEFESREEGLLAIRAMDQKKLYGRPINVKEAIPGKLHRSRNGAKPSSRPKEQGLISCPNLQ